MFFTIKKIFQCLLTPRLYNVYGSGPIEALYEPRKTEEYADTVISAAIILRGVTFYMSPFIAMFIYKQEYYNMEDAVTLAKFCCGVSCLLAMTYMVRAYGRAHNVCYLMFLDAFNSPRDNLNVYLEKLRKFDFEFYAWPATYVIPYNPDNPCWDRSRPFVSKENAHLPYYQKCIVKFLAYIAVNTFALRLIYPGTIGLIQFMLWNNLVQGRATLVESNNGQRVKIITADGNSVDTMFVDLRANNRSNGNTLVICSEGNSGFYEIGIMNTPLKSGYSVLGWNHPGFAGSTGLPYPRQEHCAIDAVMQYAIQELNFQPNNIVMFGWSIGGYSAAWAACNYHTKALILDATFDDLVPLAVHQMPMTWEPLVKEVVRSHVDLNVAEMCKHYRGPMHLIRRTDDEIICLVNGDTGTNRGNHLLVKVLRQRYADVVDPLLETLTQFAMMPEVLRPDMTDPLLSLTQRCVLRLVKEYTSDYLSSHCTPLPAEKFEEVLNYILDHQLSVPRLPRLY